MRTQRTPLLLATIAAYAFGRSACDPFAIPDPDIGGGSSVCGITQRGVGHEVCHAPDDGSNGGGGAAFTPEQQAIFDKAVQGIKGKHADEIKTLQAQLAELGTIKTKLAEADAERQAALDAKALEGKTDKEKWELQLSKSTEANKKLEADLAKLKTESVAAIAAKDKELNDHVKRSFITPLLAANAAEGASKFAEMGFFTEAQIELNEDRTLKSIAVAGKTFEKPDDAVKAFYEQNKVLAKPPSAGGSGGPRNGGGGGSNGQKMSELSPERLFEMDLQNS